MSEQKPVTINYLRISAADDTFFADLSDKLTALEEGGMDYGFFEGRNSELMFKVHESIQQKSGKLHMVSIIKEKIFTPVRFDREGNIAEAEPTLGDIAYALIDTDNRAFVLLSGRATWFADFFRWLTDDATAGTEPIFKNNARDTVMDWEVYRKLNIAVEAPSVDYADTIIDSEYGANFAMLEALKGLKIDISVSMGQGRGSLDKETVRKFINNIISEGFARKLKVSGKNFDEQSTEEIDLYNARVQHKTAVVVAGTHISPDEARSALYEAYQLELEHIVFEEE